MLVGHWMSRNPVAIEADTSFFEARLLMKESRMRRLPVLDRGTLVGVVTDLRSVVTCVLHNRPGFREIVLRVTGDQADALVRELRAKHGAGVSVLVS